MPRPRKLDWLGEKELGRATREGLTARQIHAYLWDLWGAEKIGGEVPGVRALQEAMRKYRTDPSGAWKISQAEPRDIKILMPVARAVIESSDGRERLTNLEADFALKIRAAAWDLPPVRVWEYARSYILCDEREQPSDHLDLALTLQPEPLEHDLSETYVRAIGGDLTNLMIETLPRPVLWGVAQNWPEDVEAGPNVAGIMADIAQAVRRQNEDEEAQKRSETKLSGTDGGRGNVNRKSRDRTKEAPE